MLMQEGSPKHWDFNPARDRVNRAAYGIVCPRQRRETVTGWVCETVVTRATDDTRRTATRVAGPAVQARRDWLAGKISDAEYAATLQGL